MRLTSIKSPGLNREEGRTDLANARRLIEKFGSDIRYWSERKTWLVWQGTHWAVDSCGKIARKAYLIADEMWKEARSIPCQQACNWAAKSSSKGRIDAMIHLAGPLASISTAELNQDPKLLATPNGTLNLEFGELRGSRREDYITQLCPTSFDLEAKCPQWTKFVHEIFRGDVELINFVQRLMGYCLTGLITEQKLPIFWGEGANGKSTFVETILHVLGNDHSGPMPSELLMERNRGEHPAELMTLLGRRLVVGQETQACGRLNEARVKLLTGSDSITARGMRENFCSFRPTHKLLLCTNYKPVVEGTDHAIWRRLILVPFTRTFQTHEQDRELPRKLRAEASGILNWMVEGCRQWHAEGLQTPEVVRSATCEYQCSQDVMGRFIEECCILGNEQSVKASQLYDALNGYCEENDLTPPRSNQRKSFLELRFKRIRMNAGYHFQGLDLLPDVDEP